jgi:hypothetical protein
MVISGGILTTTLIRYVLCVDLVLSSQQQESPRLVIQVFAFLDGAASP